MSNIARSIRLEADQERIRAWRFERQKVAEIERQKRLAEKEKASVELFEANTNRRDEDIESSKPHTIEVAQFDRQIAKQRRRSRLSLAIQINAILVAPMIGLVWYLFFVATPMFDSQTVIYFENPERVQSLSTSSLNLASQPHSDLQLAFAADRFTKSQTMVDALEARLSVVSHFSSEAIDPVQRIQSYPRLAFTQQQQVGRFIRSSVDIQTGFVSISVKADQPILAQNIADAVVAILGERLIVTESAKADTSYQISEENLRQAEDGLRDARSRLMELQSLFEISDPDHEIAKIQSAVLTQENEVADLNIAVRRLEIQGRGASLQTQQMITLRNELLVEIENMAASLTSGSPSLIDLQALFADARLEIRYSEKRLEDARLLHSNVKTSQAQSRANLKLVAPTSTTDIPVFPNKFAIISACFIILMSIFLFGRLTIFRSQPKYG